MKHFYLTLITCLFFGQAFAQTDFRPGYIVQHGDTLRGYVDYRGAVRSSKTTTYRPAPDAKEQAFSPDQLEGYGFDREQKIYESKRVPATEAQAEQLLFLQALVKGRISIYNYRDGNDRDHFYLSKEGANLVELVEQVYTRTDPKSGKKYRVVDRPYLGVIASAFSDCPALTEKRLENVMLRHSSLAKVGIEYNRCVGSTQFIPEPKKASITLVPVVALSFPSLHVSGSHYYARGDFRSTGLGLGGGIAMQVANPSMSEKLSLIVELLYAPYRFEGKVEGTYNTGRTTSYDLLFDLNYLKLPLQLRYTFPKGKVRPFANIGPSYSYAVHSKRVESRYSSFHSTSYSEEKEALPGSEFKSHMFGAVAGVGIVYPIRTKTLFLETRYETTEGISMLLSLPSSIKTFSLMAGYKF